jgi:hypothetical protein
MTTLACGNASNPALCDMVKYYVAPITSNLLYFLAAYFVISLLINIGQASLSGTLGDPRGRAHAFEQAIAAIILFVMGANANNIVQLILVRLTGAAAASGFEGSREAMTIIIEIIIELITGLVLIGSALRFVTSLTALNLSHQFGSSNGLSEAVMSIGITLLSVLLVFASPWIARTVVQAVLVTN